ncbi:MAG: nitroreductase family protein [Chlorobi bacterium]|nr:nitroreductase family protein [Chlorobiota bacterium]
METKILDIVAKRWSPVAFSDKPVNEKILESLFEAARWAPSAFNEQPWRFIYARREKDTAFKKMLDTLVPGNHEWAQHAPVLALSLARVFFTYNGKPNPTAYYDTGMAVGNLLAQATYMGLFVHQMSGFSAENAREALRIPDEYEPIAMMAIGYYGNAKTLSGTLREREKKPRTRKPIEALIFRGGFPAG